jgi:hypothetical protein
MADHRKSVPRRGRVSELLRTVKRPFTTCIPQDAIPKTGSNDAGL